MWQARDVMTEGLALCTPETPLAEVAALMVRYDCGSVPVVESLRSQRLIGIVTDRDLICRTLAEGLDPTTMTAGQVMSRPVVTAAPETAFRECMARMEQARIRRLPIVDAAGEIRGILSQADVTRLNPGPHCSGPGERASISGSVPTASTI